MVWLKLAQASGHGLDAANSAATAAPTACAHCVIGIRSVFGAVVNGLGPEHSSAMVLVLAHVALGRGLAQIWAGHGISSKWHCAQAGHVA